LSRKRLQPDEGEVLAASVKMGSTLLPLVRIGQRSLRVEAVAGFLGRGLSGGVECLGIAVASLAVVVDKEEA